MSDMEQRVVLGQEVDITSQTDSASTGAITALAHVKTSSLHLTAPSGVTEIRGVVAGNADKLLFVANKTGLDFPIRNEYISGVSAANRILTGLGGDMTLRNDQEVMLKYDANSQRWRIPASGAQGPQGTQGFQGAQGTQGFQGAQGTQGFQGTQGTQGFQGTQGTQGFQGTPGTVPESAPNDGTNPSFVMSGQYPAGAGDTVLDGQSCSITLTSDSDIMKFSVMLGTSHHWFEGVADFAAAEISTVTDIGEYFLKSDVGTGIYVWKTAGSRVINFKNRMGSTEVITIQFHDAKKASTVDWA